MWPELTDKGPSSLNITAGFNSSHVVGKTAYQLACSPAKLQRMMDHGCTQGTRLLRAGRLRSRSTFAARPHMPDKNLGKNLRRLPKASAARGRLHGGSQPGCQHRPKDAM